MRIRMMMAALLGGVLTAVGQPALVVDRYTVDNGLPDNTVHSAYKDDVGFLWFGTWHGLCSFDGARFCPFITRTDPSSPMPPRKITDIVEDADGYMWIRNADHHLFIYSKQADSFHEVYEELEQRSQNVQVIKIQRTKEGRVLLLTRNKNLYLARTGPDMRAELTQVCDAARHIDPATLTLRENVVGETDSCVYWIGTDFSMLYVRKKHGGSLLTGIPQSERFTCMAATDDEVYIGLESGAIYTVPLQGGGVRKRPFPEMGSISCILADRGKLTVGAATGLYETGSAWQAVRKSAAVDHASQLYRDKDGNVWAYSKRQHRLWCLTADGQLITREAPGERLVAKAKFAEVDGFGLFILLPNGEVCCYNAFLHDVHDVTDDEAFRQYNIARPARFYDIHADREQLLWLCNTQDGVFKVSFPSSYFSFHSPLFRSSGLPAKESGYRAVCQQRDGLLWVANRDNEVYCVDVTSGQTVRKYVGVMGDVYHIMEDREGRLWFSTKGNGLFLAEPDQAAPQGLRLTHFVNDTADSTTLNDDRVYYTFQDREGHLWVCTFGGGLNLIRQEGGRTTFVNKDNGLAGYPKYDSYTSVRSMAEDREGRLWVSTTDGLMSFDASFGSPADIRFETYRSHETAQPLDNDILSLYQDREGNIWMSIFGSGLNRLEGYDRKRHTPLLEHFSLSGTLNGNTIASLIEDGRKRLWICTENSITRFDPKSGEMRDYDRYGGFPSVKIEENTIACLQDGHILVGSKQGLVSFHPDTLEKDKRHRHHIVITGFKVQNKDLSELTPPVYKGSVRYADRLTLKHYQNMFTVEFAVLDFTGQRDVAYQYILEGYEKQWHDNGASRTASYSNIPPGKYTLRIRTTDPDSIERRLVVRVLPPWWATWWAYCIYALLFLVLLWGIVKGVLALLRMRNEMYINQKLTELKIRFFTNVSHELRTPLTLITTPIEELKRNEQLSATGKEYLGMIDHNAKKMLQLVNQILDFRKVQNGKMSLHVSLTDIGELLELLRQEYLPAAKEKGICFDLQRPDGQVTAWCDRQKIGVVAGNLVNNAFKYTPSGGTICVVLEDHPEQNRCRIRVEDDGTQIPQDKLEAIFDRFARVENGDEDTAVAGTGIGLSLSKEFVLMHKGRIWAENTDNGVAFVVDLPTDKEHFDPDVVEEYMGDRPREEEGDDAMTVSGAMPAEQDGNEADAGAPLVMIIEDNAELCRMISLFLRNHYRVETAADGEEGLRKIRQYVPDVIVCDLMMPKMSGMEVLRRVREDFTVSHIPVIILTAKQEKQTQMQAIRKGANAFITKPFSGELLLARIGQLMEAQRIFQRKMTAVRQQVPDKEAVQDETADAYGQHLIRQDVEFVARIREIIGRHVGDEDFNIDSIAAEMGLSRSPFYKKLKSLTGLSPVELVKEVRLDKALELARNTDLSSAEIAWRTGFRDAGYFSRCFRQRFGKSVKAMRSGGEKC